MGFPPASQKPENEAYILFKGERLAHSIVHMYCNKVSKIKMYSVHEIKDRVSLKVYQLCGSHR